MIYVYIYRDKGQPIYVGKGTGQRAWWHLCNNKGHLGNILRKRKIEGQDLHPQIIECIDDADAIELEIFLISEIGRQDLGTGPLINLTAGGDGAAGYKHAESAKARIAQSNSRRVITETTKQKISATLKKMYTDTEKRKLAGIANRGRILSEEHRKKMSDATKGKPKSEETKQRMKNAWVKRRLKSYS